MQSNLGELCVIWFQLKHVDDTFLYVRRESRVVVRQKNARHVTVFPLEIGRVVTQ